jgi:hypothetical protein
MSRLSATSRLLSRGWGRGLRLVVWSCIRSFRFFRALASYASLEGRRARRLSPTSRAAAGTGRRRPQDCPSPKGDGQSQPEGQTRLLTLHAIAALGVAPEPVVRYNNSP